MTVILGGPTHSIKFAQVMEWTDAGLAGLAEKRGSDWTVRVRIRGIPGYSFSIVKCLLVHLGVHAPNYDKALAAFTRSIYTRRVSRDFK